MSNDVGKRLRQLRESKGLTRKEAAKALDEPYTSYCHYEDGGMELKASTLIKLHYFYDVSADWIIGHDSKTKTPPPDDQWEGLRKILETFSNDELKEVLSFVRFIEWKMNQK